MNSYFFNILKWNVSMNDCKKIQLNQMNFFPQFLWVLKYLLKLNKNKIKKKVWITLDNAPDHTAYNVLKCLNLFDAKFYFLISSFYKFSSGRAIP